MQAGEQRPNEDLSDTRVPGVAVFGRRGTESFAESFQAIGDGKAGDVFDALVAELTRNTQSKRPAEFDWQIASIHAVGD